MGIILNTFFFIYSSTLSIEIWYFTHLLLWLWMSYMTENSRGTFNLKANLLHFACHRIESLMTQAVTKMENFMGNTLYENAFYLKCILYVCLITHLKCIFFSIIKLLKLEIRFQWIFRKFVKLAITFTSVATLTSCAYLDQVRNVLSYIR